MPTLETVVDGVTGIHFSEQTSESLVKAIVQFDSMRGSFRVGDLVNHAKRFDKACFKRNFLEFVEATKPAERN